MESGMQSVKEVRPRRYYCQVLEKPLVRQNCYVLHLERIESSSSSFFLHRIQQKLSHSRCIVMLVNLRRTRSFVYKSCYLRCKGKNTCDLDLPVFFFLSEEEVQNWQSVGPWKHFYNNRRVAAQACDWRENEPCFLRRRTCWLLD
jgi:hypothetical protein